MSFVSPDFEVDSKADSVLITAQIPPDLSPLEAEVDSYIYGEKVESGKPPKIFARKFATDKVLLSPLQGTGEAMWLKKDGTIVIER